MPPNKTEVNVTMRDKITHETMQLYLLYLTLDIPTVVDFTGSNYKLQNTKKTSPSFIKWSTITDREELGMGAINQGASPAPAL